MLRYSRGTIAVGCSFIVTSLLASCSSSSDHHATAKPNLGPVRDSAPYWCQLIPRRSLQTAISVKGQLKQDQDIDLGSSDSTCEVGTEAKLPLEVELALSDEAKLQEKDEFAHNRPEMTLPADLGKALFREAPAPPDFGISAGFSCDKKPVWIRIVIRSLADGRDPKIDLPAFLRIAEDRYSKLARCTIEATASIK